MPATGAHAQSRGLERQQSRTRKRQRGYGPYAGRVPNPAAKPKIPRTSRIQPPVPNEAELDAMLDGLLLDESESGKPPQVAGPEVVPQPRPTPTTPSFAVYVQRDGITRKVELATTALSIKCKFDLQRFVRDFELRTRLRVGVCELMQVGLSCPDVQSCLLLLAHHNGTWSLHPGTTKTSSTPSDHSFLYHDANFTVYEIIRYLIQHPGLYTDLSILCSAYSIHYRGGVQFNDLGVPRGQCVPHLFSKVHLPSVPPWPTLSDLDEYGRDNLIRFQAHILSPQLRHIESVVLGCPPFLGITAKLTLTQHRDYMHLESIELGINQPQMIDCGYSLPGLPIGADQEGNAKRARNKNPKQKANPRPRTRKENPFYEEYMTPPQGFTPEEWKQAIKHRRQPPLMRVPPGSPSEPGLRYIDKATRQVDGRIQANADNAKIKRELQHLKSELALLRKIPLASNFQAGNFAAGNFAAGNFGASDFAGDIPGMLRELKKVVDGEILHPKILGTPNAGSKVIRSIAADVLNLSGVLEDGAVLWIGGIAQCMHKGCIVTMQKPGEMYKVIAAVSVNVDPEEVAQQVVGLFAHLKVRASMVVGGTSVVVSKPTYETVSGTVCPTSILPGKAAMATTKSESGVLGDDGIDVLQFNGAFPISELIMQNEAPEVNSDILYQPHPASSVSALSGTEFHFLENFSCFDTVSATAMGWQLDPSASTTILSAGGISPPLWQLTSSNSALDAIRFGKFRADISLPLQITGMNADSKYRFEISIVTTYSDGSTMTSRFLQNFQVLNSFPQYLTLQGSIDLAGNSIVGVNNLTGKIIVEQKLFLNAAYVGSGFGTVKFDAPAASNVPCVLKLDYSEMPRNPYYFGGKFYQFNQFHTITIGYDSQSECVIGRQFAKAAYVDIDPSNPVHRDTLAEAIRMYHTAPEPYSATGFKSFIKKVGHFLAPFAKQGAHALVGAGAKALQGALVAASFPHNTNLTPPHGEPPSATSFRTGGHVRETSFTFPAVRTSGNVGEVIQVAVVRTSKSLGPSAGLPDPSYRSPIPVEGLSYTGAAALAFVQDLGFSIMPGCYSFEVRDFWVSADKKVCGFNCLPIDHLAEKSVLEDVNGLGPDGWQFEGESVTCEEFWSLITGANVTVRARENALGDPYPTGSRGYVMQLWKSA